jgi:hypothetical protein
MTDQEVRVLDVVGKDIGGPTGANFGRLLCQLSADPAKARDNRGRFVLAFDTSGLGIRDTPTYAIPGVRTLFRELERGCPHAAYFLHGDPGVAAVETFLLSLIPVVHSTTAGWQFTLQDYLAAFSQHTERVKEFCRRIGDDEDAGTQGLLMSLPPEAIVDRPDLRARVLRALTPALQAAARDFQSLNSHPEGRQLLSDLLHRAEPLALLPRSATPSAGAFARVLGALQRR